MNIDDLQKSLELFKASLSTKKIDKLDSDKLEEKLGNKMKQSKHMNGKNVEQYNHEGEKKLNQEIDRVAKDEDLEARIKQKKEQFRQEEAKKSPDPMKINTRIAARDMKKEEGPDMASPEKPKGLENKRKPVTHDECGRPFAKADMKMKLVKALADSGHRESALLLKNWDEMDAIAEQFAKSNYGPKGMDLYSEKDNAERKKKNTGEEYENVGQNKKAKKYTTMGSSMSAAHEKAQQKKYDKEAKASIKTYSPEEIKAMSEARGLKKSEDDLPPKCNSCGHEGVKFKAKNELGTWYDCPGCKTTGLVAKDVKKGDLEVAPEGSKNRETYLKEFKKSEIEISEWDDGVIEIDFHDEVAPEVEHLVKKLEEAGYEELEKKKNWQPKAKHKSKKGGLTAAGRKSYNKATGGNLKAPQPGGGPRKRSFCARNKGQIDMHNIDCKKDPDKRACKARRRWKC